jgi:cytidylate kinase
LSRLKKSIIIIGAISSGKSTIAKHISEEYGIKIASFGGYLNDYSLRNRLPNDRKSLQDLGDDFIKNQSEKFLLDVIEFSGSNADSLIFEGVRHVIILDLIKAHSTRSLSIFIDVPYDVRKERYLQRNKGIDSDKSSQEFDARNSHVVEMEVPGLKNFCDLTTSSSDDALLQNSLKDFFGT